MIEDISGWQVRLDASDIAGNVANGAWRGVTVAQEAANRAVDLPHKLAVVDGEQRITFGALQAQAMHLAAYLADLGLKPGDVVSFQLPNWLEAVVINLAACMGGFVINPIVPIYRDAEVGYILKDARSRLIFVPDTFRGMDYVSMVERLRPALPHLQHVVVVRGHCGSYTSYTDLMGDVPRSLDANDPVIVDPNAVKLLLYTSGTTGAPKGVLHSHNTLRAEIDAVIKFWALTDADVVLMPTPVTHITGYLYALELTLAIGCELVLMDRWQPATAAKLIGDHKVTFTIGATPFLAELVHELESRHAQLPSLKLFPCGGATVPADLITRACKVLPACLPFRVFGSSEAPSVTLGVMAGDPPELGAMTDGCVFNHTVRIVDPQTGFDLPEGMEGEILTRGPEVMLGYTKWSDTLDAFDPDGFFRTGDLGYVSHRRYLTISGRKKDLIIRGGENISPREIEDVLLLHPDIKEAAVVAMPHSRMGETAAAYIVLHGDRALQLQDVVTFLEQRGLARQKFPERLIVMSELPRTLTGKVLKHVLRNMSLASEPNLSRSAE